MPRPLRSHKFPLTARLRRNHGVSFLILALSACASPPADEPHNATAPNSTVVERAANRGLVDVRAFLPDVVCDLRYGTSENITGHVLYPPNMPCLLHRTTAEKLAHAQDLLRPQGYGLKIWDAWRPPEVQTELFRYGQRTGKAALFVNPQEAWSFHCAGGAVDLTLVDSQGREMSLPSYFDESGPRAHIMTPISDPRILRNIRALQDAMVQAGFTMIDLEWWHFDDSSLKEDNASLQVVFARDIGLAIPRLK